MLKPRPLIKKAVALITSRSIPVGVAIDFGIGSGDETSYLLQNGYSVIAIDNFKEFLTEVKLRKDTQPYLDKITTIQANFEVLEWDKIPQVDIFLASFSLCFVQQKQFHRVWKNIVSHIKPGGFFVGHLYTHHVVNVQEEGYFLKEIDEFIPFLTTKDMKELFNEFKIEYFDDARVLYDVPIDNEVRRVYSVIAQKKMHHE